MDTTSNKAVEAATSETSETSEVTEAKSNEASADTSNDHPGSLAIPTPATGAVQAPTPTIGAVHAPTRATRRVHAPTCACGTGTVRAPAGATLTIRTPRATLTVSMSSPTTVITLDPSTFNEWITIKVADNTTEVFFRIRRTNRLGTLMRTYCRRQGVEDMENARFVFDGHRIHESETADEVSSFCRQRPAYL